tara:strand:- start:579 stop:1274 length:696 start_codon:yes stop_codon:yes gene_type:complete
MANKIDYDPDNPFRTDYPVTPVDATWDWLNGNQPSVIDSVNHYNNNQITPNLRNDQNPTNIVGETLVTEEDLINNPADPFSFLGETVETNPRVFDYEGETVETEPRTFDDPYANQDLSWWRKNINPADNKMVQSLQRFLGIKDDGIFGKNTQAAWRKAVAGDQVAKEKDPLRYDYNKDLLASRMGEKSKLGGKLARAWHNLDKKVGGWLPGGYDRDASNLTEAEYQEKYNK